MENGTNQLQTASVNGKAITSLVLGIVSLVMVFLFVVISPILSIVGLVFGIIALKEIKRTEQNGRGLAIAGNICSVVGLILSVIIIVFLVIGIVSFMQMETPPM
ncbi:protein of unknown function [Alteribacillus persepolensis]|uniref:DUF4190 domain-containing protein n=1 Tax=Alteribacillus persepolensis TaxID=568899 RepID=A0A1G8G742_9BACI|nr:DUF4190 domain-containing protein [Alteribacillus persepolensis]SDH90214.1 protein of unknown function [Alteribacillus persepolensis]